MPPISELQKLRFVYKIEEEANVMIHIRSPRVGDGVSVTEEPESETIAGSRR